MWQQHIRNEPEAIPTTRSDTIPGIVGRLKKNWNMKHNTGKPKHRKLALNHSPWEALYSKVGRCFPSIWNIVWQFPFLLLPLRSVLRGVEPYHQSSTTDVAAITTCPPYKAGVRMQSALILSLPHYLFLCESDLLIMVRQTEKRRQFLLHRAIDMWHIKPAPRRCWILIMWYFISPHREIFLNA